MESLSEFTQTEFHQRSPCYQQANQIKTQIESDRTFNVIRVRGDGLCLIRAIIANINYLRDRDTVFNILQNFTDNYQELLNLFDQKEYSGNIIDDMCCNIKNQIIQKWDYKGCPEYHMDENSIDGLAVHFVMRLLCVSKLTIYSLKPEPEKTYYQTIEIDSKYFMHNISGWHVSLICAQGKCHYSALV
jgi:hypothetical protein